MNKSSIAAFFLGLIPGFGHIYWGHKGRGILYALTFIASVMMTVFAFLIGFYDVIILVLFGMFIWGVSFIDIILTLFIGKVEANKQIGTNELENTKEENGQDRVATMLLSIIPGMGHFYLGLSYRGLTILAAFVGVIIMVIFISFLTSAIFLIFLLALPIIWIYSMFDIIQLLNKQQAGEKLEDRTLMDDFNHAHDNDRKSKMLTTILAIFPGAGHLYLGLQQRGIQLMIGFLLSIYLLDVLHLSLFLFMIPILWFYSFFDALQLANRYEYEVLEDVPVINYFINYQKWIAFGLILLGVFYLIDAFVLPVFGDYFMDYYQINLWLIYDQYVQVILVCLLLIGSGIAIAVNHRKAKKKEGN
ncbi:hypothetical protein SH601_09410 [Gracilibacillus sp. S3-1-1]|uniref:Uncharacterized protein n=1 Tax=Gracilibacillus pellucidus TaxID=3095368 RepID=A0ACC6M5Y2_9BACI|nr:hypothetical protein [Gracilibacillus sp. S3-1-1]MDX8046207.1 hypothetical protein [Gracilibacillus sp. S3-1-1]